MKKKNIVHDVSKKTPIYKDKRWTLVILLLLLVLCLSVMTMPMADIPFLGRMGHIFGLNDESMRSLNFTDFAAYSLGAKDGGRLASVRDNQYSVYENFGGLSPFSLQTGKRLIDAKESYLTEFDRTGKWNNIRGSALGRDIEDSEGIDVNNYYDRDGALAPMIDAESAKGYEDTYGKPFVNSGQDASLDAAYEASSATEYDFNGVMVLRTLSKNKPFRSADTGTIKSARSDESNMYFQAVDSKVRALRGGRLGSIGGNGAKTMRVGTSIGSGKQLNFFGNSGKDMSRVYYLSYQARVQKYNDVVKNVAEAAWDGGEVEAEDMVAVGEKAEKEVNSLDKTPSTIINKVNAAGTACKDAVKEGTDKINELSKELDKEVSKLDDLMKNNKPCSCTPIGKMRKCKKNCDKWNDQLEVIRKKCEAIRAEMKDFTSTCGFNYSESPDADCDRYTDEMKAGTKSFWGNLTDWKNCRKVVNLKNSKYEKAENRKALKEEITKADRIDKNDPLESTEKFLGFDFHSN